MNSFINEFFETIDYNLIFIKKQINTIIDNLENYKECYNINDIFGKELDKGSKDPFEVLRASKNN